MTVTVAVAVAISAGRGSRPAGARRPSSEGVASTPEPGPLAVHDLEPNDRYEDAQMVGSLPAEISGTLVSGDRDVFRFEVTKPGGHLLDVSFEGTAEVRLEIRNGTGTEVAAVTTPESLGAIGVISGRYTLVISRATRPRPDPNPDRYRLALHLSEWRRGLAWEPDDTIDKAQDLAMLPPAAGEISHHTAAGWWSRSDDVDCFKLPLTVPAAGAVLRVELRPPPQTRARLWIADSNAARVPGAPTRLAETAGASPGETVIIPALGARSWERFYFVCAAMAGGAVATAPYVLDVRSRTPPGPFEFEGNDSRGTATALPFSIVIEGYLTVQDVDWFRIPGNPVKPLRLVFTAPPRVSAEILLWGEKGPEIAVVEAAPGHTITLLQRAAAFVEVRAKTGGNSSDTYKIRAN